MHASSNDSDQLVVMQGHFLGICLLAVSVCYASGAGLPVSAQAASLPCTPCKCRELEVLGRTVATACATPGIAALPQMLAACALADAFTVRPADKAMSARLLPTSNQTQERMETPSLGRLLPLTRPLQRERNGAAARIMNFSNDDFAHQSDQRRTHLNEESRSSTNGMTERYRRIAPGSSCTPSSVAGSLQAQCAVSGCEWNYASTYVALTCDDAASAAALTSNQTTCFSLAQPCPVWIELSLPTRPLHPGSLHNAAMLLSLWQDNASVALRGQWGEQGLSAVLQYAHNINHLDASSAGVSTLSSDSFAKLTSLRVLLLEGNAIRSIATDTFSSLTKLERLWLGENELKALPRQLFHNCPLLVYIGLTSNQLTELDATLFQGLSLLKELGLNRNRLTLLPDGIFEDLSSLSTLSLHDNKLATADASVFHSLSALKVLYLQNNPLDRLQAGLLVLPAQLRSLSELWLESTGVSNLHLRQANTTLKYLTVAHSRLLTEVSLGAGTRVVQADVTNTALRIAALPCQSLGYQGLVARSMLHMSTIDLLDNCMGDGRQFLDVSDNGERHVHAVRHSLLTEAASFLMDNASWTLRSGQDVRGQPVTLSLVGSPVQCSIDMVQTYVSTSTTKSFYQREPLQVFRCSCIPGYYDNGGICYKTIPFVATPGGIVTVVLTTLLAAGLLALCQKRFKKRLHRARHDLEMQRGLLEYAETEVLALKRVWEIDANEMTLVKRIDGDSEGAFGAVWRGDWDGMVVAVKVLRAGLLELDSSFADEFDREADFLMRARHANVVRFFGAGRMPGGEPFVVLELVSRGSLRGLLRGDLGSQLDGALKQRLALDVARGMAYIHSLGALHRDLKSGNVLVTENWRGKVADFGSMRTLLASVAAGGASSSTRAARASNGVTMSAAVSSARELTLTAGVGTPLYMSLEVLRGDDYGEAADVWAFGVMVWELVKERSPDLLLEMGEEQGRGPLLGRLLKLLEAGKRLQLDVEAPAWAQRLVTECTLAEASNRPSFALLKDRLAITTEEYAGSGASN